MNILCDMISARQGFNKQQENVFSPSIPSSFSVHIPSNHWHHEVNRLMEPQWWWNVAVIGSSSEPKLRSSQEGLCVHRSPNAEANWLNKGKNLSSCNLSSGVLFISSLLLFPLSFCALLLWIKVRMWEERVRSIVGKGRYVGILEFIQHRYCYKDCQSVKNWFIDTK